MKKGPVETSGPKCARRDGTAAAILVDARAFTTNMTDV
jgi:hypothetical protein